MNGQWPTDKTSSEAAYKMMAKPGDPGFVSVEEAAQLQKNSDVIFLDARSSKDYSEGRIPGARSLPYYELESHQDQALTGVQAETQVIIYCEGVGCELSFFLGRELQMAGYKNIRIFYGGFPEWKSAGLPIEK